MELSRKKNVATTIYFPLIQVADGTRAFTGTAWAALTNEVLSACYDDGAGENALALDGTPTECTNVIGGWKLAISQTHMNHDRIMIKLTADEIADQFILINTVHQANVYSISDDTTAADNCELAYDGTGFGFTNCTMPTVTTTGTVTTLTDSAANNATIAKSVWDALLAGYGATNTMFGYAFKASNTITGADVGKWLGTTVATPAVAGVPSVDTIYISGDATAANNCELMFDGTGYAGGTTKLDVNTYSMSTDALSAAAVSAGAVTKIQTGITPTSFLAATADGIAVSTILERLNAWVKGKYAISTTGANTDVTYYKEDGTTGSFKNRIVSTGRTVQSV